MKLNSILKELINEISIEDIKNTFVNNPKSPDKSLSQSEFDKIVKASNGKSAYATWLAVNVMSKKIKEEDIYKFQKYLEVFSKNQNSYPSKDINVYGKSTPLQDFIKISSDLISKIEINPSLDKGKSKTEKYAKYKIGEVDGFSIYEIPKGATHLKDMACELGSGTEWCTSHSDASHFETTYIPEGPLFIIINNKNPGEKYQFHYESGQFMDKYDNDIVS
jgi:hypothetical protein